MPVKQETNSNMVSLELSAPLKLSLISFTNSVAVRKSNSQVNIARAKNALSINNVTSEN